MRSGGGGRDCLRVVVAVCGCSRGADAGDCPVTSGQSVGQVSTELEGLVHFRRALHANPELRFTERSTGELIAARIGPLCDKLVTDIAGTGLLGTIHGLTPGPHVLIRADMDAYPVRDLKDVDYASRVPGVSHACGHDIHMTVATGVTARMAAKRPPAGSLSILFQPAEEIPFGERSGAQEVLRSGVFGSQHFDAVLGLHCWPGLAAGTIGIDRDIAMAAKDAFRVVLSGRSAHAATPSRGRDSILGMSVLVSALHAAIARRHDPAEMVAFNIGTTQAGSTQSQVADRAECTGTLRTLEQALRERLKDVIQNVVWHTAEAFDLESELTWANEMPPVRNDPALVALADRELSRVVGTRQLAQAPLTTDDFALLNSLGRSLYLKLGIANEDGVGHESLHSPKFDVDERCITAGVDTIEHLARAVLSGSLDQYIDIDKQDGLLSA